MEGSVALITRIELVYYDRRCGLGGAPEIGKPRKGMWTHWSEKGKSLKSGSSCGEERRGRSERV